MERSKNLNTFLRNKKITALIAAVALAGCGSSETASNGNNTVAEAPAVATSTPKANTSPANTTHESGDSSYNGNFAPLFPPEVLSGSARVFKGDKTAEDSIMRWLPTLQKDHPEISEEMERAALERGYVTIYEIGDDESSPLKMTKSGDQIPADSLQISAKVDVSDKVGEQLRYYFDNGPQSPEGNA
jgi:hypothetical protein